MLLTAKSTLSSALTLLLASSVSASPAPVPAAVASAADKWAFSIYQGANCAGGPGYAFNFSGSASQSCGPYYELAFNSVIVSNNNNGKCVFTFATGTNSTGGCSGNVVSCPGTIKVGSCYNFKAPTPRTFGVKCS